ncbi:MAG: transcription-repair coupling factor [Armatimonadetes bacterium]|nr:transcription-repair coupling factor [Armatimonadota bacterium]
MLQGLLALLREAPEYHQVRSGLGPGAQPPSVLGPAGAAAAFVTAAVATDAERGAGPLLVVAPSQDSAERLADDLETLLAGEVWTVGVYPDPPAGASSGVASDGTADDAMREADAAVTSERLGLLEALADGRPVIAVASAAAVIEPLPPPEAVRAATRLIRPGQLLPRDRFVAELQAYEYERAALVTRMGEFAVRGGIVDVFPAGPAGSVRPVRFELWGDELDSIRAIDPLSQRSLERLPEVTIRPARLDAGVGEAVALPAYLPAGGLLVLVEPAEAEGVARSLAERAQRAGTMTPLAWSRATDLPADRRRLAISAARPPEGRWHDVRLATAGVEAFGGQTHLLAQMLSGLAGEGMRVVIASAQAGSVMRILADAGLAITLVDRIVEPPPAGRLVAVPAPLSRGFRWDAVGLAVITDAEIVGWRRRRPRMRFLRDGERLASWADLSPGDLVVHIHHGIGRYRGLVRLPMDGSEREYLLLEYAQNDRLYVPTDQIQLVQRYIGVEGEEPRIHRLGGAEWDREKRRVKEAAREMAASLLALYAARATTPGHAFAPDTPWQREMEAAFPFQETPHQLRVIEEVKRDMESPRPMDRLVAGDVGYGKTEVALRAAFKAVMDGKQVAVVVPTTILAQQHYNLFCERFAKFPVTVELLSRFRTRAEQKVVLEKTAAGLVDVLIGTHRILGRDVRFRHLGLVIIDEEQRFGVVHKEHLKQLRKSVDVLTLTATPIPRTLHMSLAGLRDLSVMETPPEARLPIHTEIRPEDDDLIREAILRERARGGQVYVVHNRVDTIERAARRIRRLAPEMRVGVAHGQMPEERLERVMLDFLGGRLDVLVCTTIVEIGLDIPQVNTIIIEDGHLMGLAQLYQLRGRVGRADRQAYCYLLYPRSTPLTPEAEQRLRAMAEFVELGSGLALAMRDLEIRGAGNILGPEQHGQVAAVGFDLYCRLLDEAIREARGEIVEEARDPTLELGVDAYLPPSLVPDELERMAYYRRLAAARTSDEVDQIAAELSERTESVPEAAQALLDAVRVRVVARSVGVTSITREGRQFIVRLTAGGHLDEAAQRRLRAALGGRAQVTGVGLSIRVSGQEFSDQIGTLCEVLAMVGRVSAQAGSVSAVRT